MKLGQFRKMTKHLADHTEIALKDAWLGHEIKDFPLTRERVSIDSSTARILIAAPVKAQED